MKNRMTREEIAKAKREAKKRNNRRLSDGESLRIMALYRPKDSTDDNDLSVIDVNKENFTIPELILESARNLVNARKPVKAIKSIKMSVRDRGQVHYDSERESPRSVALRSAFSRGMKANH